MITCIFIFCTLNYYTFAHNVPDWFRAVSVVGQCICLLIALGVWDKQKAEFNELKKEFASYKNNKNERN